MDGRGILAELAPTEGEVLARFLRGRTVTQIADSLGLSEGTVRCHIAGLLIKLGACSPAEAAALQFGADESDLACPLLKSPPAPISSAARPASRTGRAPAPRARGLGPGWPTSRPPCPG